MIDTQGKLLVAPPNMTDWRFQKSVVYIWKHDVSGAAGCIINKRVKNPTWQHICNEGGVPLKSDIQYPTWYGGPVLSNLIGVLHTPDYAGPQTNGMADSCRFTLDRKILVDIADNKGPEQFMITIGLSNWEANQLDAELEAVPPRPSTMSWLVLDYDKNLVFGKKESDFWEMCVSRAVANKTSELTNKIFKN